LVYNVIEVNYKNHCWFLWFYPTRSVSNALVQVSEPFAQGWSRR
jgi:hypothetical protein